MDRVIQRKKMPSWQWVLIAIALLAASWFAYTLLVDASIRTYRVSADQLIVSSVEYDAFEDAIPIRGTIQPFNSVFLDAENGGAVEEVFVEEGSFVEAGQPLLQLSNTNLRLSAAQNDTNITEQLNLLNNITDGFETTKLSTQRQRTRHEQLVEDGLVSIEQYDAIVDELSYQAKVLANHQARQELENRIRETRLIQIATQVDKLEENLEVSKSSFESLLVRAPIAGQLTSLPVEIGESK